MSLLTKLRSYYRLEETVGTTTQDSQGYSDGTITTALSTTGILGNARSFLTGSADVVTIANTPNRLTLPFDGLVSFQVWIRIHNPGLFPVKAIFVHKDNFLPNQPEWEIRGTGANFIRFQIDDGTTVYTLTSAATITDSNWHHIVVTCAGFGNDGKMYIDGGLSVTSTITTGSAFFPGPVFIGNDESLIAGAGADIDEVAVWLRVLTPTEVSTLYNSGAGVNFYTDPLAENLVGYWTLNETTGLRLDTRTHFNDLTAVGAVDSIGGLVGNAASFPLTNTFDDYFSKSFADTGDPFNLDPTNDDFTIAGWVHLDAKTTNMVAWGNGDFDFFNTGIMLYYHQASDRFRFFLNAGTGDTQVSANNFGSPSIGTWYFVVCKYNAATDVVSIRVNGGVADTAIHTPGTSAGAWFLGRGLPDDIVPGWRGRIDAVGFWSRVLTTAEEDSLYNGGAGFSGDFNFETVSTVQQTINSNTEVVPLTSKDFFASA